MEDDKIIRKAYEDLARLNEHADWVDLTICAIVGVLGALWLAPRLWS